MIAYLKGEVADLTSDYVVIDVNGVGYLVFVSARDVQTMPGIGSCVTLYTFLNVYQDGMALYGFADTEGLALFEQLITVKGVGPKAGLAIMSLGTPNQIKGVIAAGDAASIAMAQGIGKKTAERVILELKDKVSALPFEGVEPDGIAPAAVPGTGERGEAVVALTTLGYTKKEAEAAVGSVPDEGLTAEEYVKKSLKFLL